MFTIQVESGFLIYLCIMLVGLCVIGIQEMWRRRVQHWSLSEEQLAHCAECNYTFVVRRSETVARCPRCNTLCQTRRR